MFTFCFTTLAVANLRRQAAANKARKTGAARAVRRSLAALIVVAATTGVAYAGGPSKAGKSFSSSGKSGNSLRINSTSKLNFSKAEPKFNTIKKLDVKPKTQIFTVDRKPTIKLSDNNTPKLSDKLNGKFPIKGKPSDVAKSDKAKDTGNAAKSLVKNKHSFPWWWLYFGGIRNNNNYCYKPCPQWDHCWDYPVWRPLYRDLCGNWYDVPDCYVGQGIDLQLLAIRRVDSGNAAQGLGPMYRVWFRNNSAINLYRNFNVLLIAAPGTTPSLNLPQSGVQIDAIGAGQTLAVDIRLPGSANSQALKMLHVLVDSHRNVKEVYENNNGIVLARSNILDVDPTVLVANSIPTATP